MSDSTPAHAYATYFDSGYLTRGLALISSLREHGDIATVWVMCLDDDAQSYLDALGDPSIRTLRATDLEAVEPRLSPLRSSRSRMEFYFTCTPLLLRFVQSRLNATGGVVIYLDADLYFFDSPARALDSLGSGSVGIIEHRYPARLAKRLGKYGRFNVGWVGFRDDDDGRRCLDWWVESCLAWCSDTPEDGKYADQGYLDQFPELVGSVVVMQGAGLNLAPWNTGRHHVETVLDNSGVASVTADGDPLDFFHFHGVRRRRRQYLTSQLVYGSPLGRALREGVYVPYLKRLEECEAQVASSPVRPERPAAKRGTGLRGLVFAAQRRVIDGVSILSGNAVAVSSLVPRR